MELEVEVNKLKLDVKASTSKASKLEFEKKSADATISTLQTDLAHQQQFVKDTDANIASLEEKITKLTLDVEDLETEKNLGWQSEKEKLSKDSFEDGVKEYCKTFLAGEPSYNWSAKFGNRMATFMTEFAEKEAEAIVAKRAELVQARAAEEPELARQGDQANLQEQETEDQANQDVVDTVADAVDPNPDVVDTTIATT